MGLDKNDIAILTSDDRNKIANIVSESQHLYAEYDTLMICIYGKGIINIDKVKTLGLQVININDNISLFMTNNKIMIISNKFICLHTCIGYYFINNHVLGVSHDIGVELKNVYVDDYFEHGGGNNELFLNNTGPVSAFVMSHLISLKVSNIYFSECVKSLSNLFFGCERLRDVYIGDNVCPSNIKSIESIFKDCFSLKEIHIKNKVDLSSCEDISDMFMNCRSFQNKNHFETKVIIKNIREAVRAFIGCVELEELYLNSWDTSKLYTTASMFRCCYNLKVLEIDKWDVSRILTCAMMFDSDTRLSRLDLSNWEFDSAIDLASMFVGIGTKVDNSKKELKLNFKRNALKSKYTQDEIDKLNRMPVLQKRFHLSNLYVDTTIENIDLTGIDLCDVLGDYVVMKSKVGTLDIRNHDLAKRDENTVFDIYECIIDNLIVTFSENKSVATLPLIRNCSINTVTLLCETNDPKEKEQIKRKFILEHQYQNKIKNIECITV